MNTVAALFITPILIIVFLVYMKYKFQMSTFKFVWQALILGIVASLMLVISNYVAAELGFDQLRNLRRTAFHAFVVIGFSAEVGKFVFLRYYFLPKKHFMSSFEGIIYAIIISLGFSLVAVVLFNYGIVGQKIDALFLYTYGFANIIFAILAGFFVGLGKSRKNHFVDSMTGLFAASFCHGLYIFCFLTKDYRLLIALTVGVILIAILLFVKAVRLKTEERQQELV